MSRWDLEHESKTELESRERAFLKAQSLLSNKTVEAMEKNKIGKVLLKLFNHF